MVQAHAAEAETPELTPAQLSEMAGGYEHSETPYVPRGAEATQLDQQRALDVLDSRPDVARRFFRLLGAGAGAAALAFLLAACGPSDSGPTDGPTPVKTDTPAPVDTETPAPIPEKFDFKVSKADIQAYLDQGQDAFVGLSAPDRALVALYFAQDMPKFASDWYSVSKNPNDQLTAPLSVDMTPQQIVNFIGYLHRMPYTIPAEDGYHLDTNAANKMIAGTFIDPNSTPSYGYFIDGTDQFANDGGAVGTARTLAVSHYLEPSLVDESHTSELVDDGHGNKMRTIRVVQADNTVYDVKCYWVVASNGVGIWMQGEQTEVK